MISLFKKITLFKNTTFLEKLFFSYFIIFPFYIPLRALVYDSPLWRDIPVILMFVMTISIILHSGRIFRLNLLDILVLSYLVYGVLGLNLRLGDLDQLEALKVLRTYFSICLLYFVARYIFRKADNFSRLYQAAIILAILIAADVIIESIMINVFFINKNILPWYVWGAAQVKDIGKAAVAGSETIFVRVPTIYSYAHGALLLLGGLTAYLLPSLLAKAKGHFSRFRIFGKVLRYKPNTWLLGVLVLAIFLGYVKVVILTFVLIIIFDKIFFLPRTLKFMKLIIIIPLVLLALNLVLPSLIKKGLHSVPIVVENVTKQSLYPIDFFREENLSKIIIGSFKHELGRTDFYLDEVRILSFTLRFGLIWLLIYLAMTFTALKRCFKGTQRTVGEERLFFIGSLGFFIMYFADMFHNALAIAVINMDIWLIFLAAIASRTNILNEQRKRYENNRHLAIRA